MTGRSLRYNFKIEAIEWIKKIALGCLRFFKKKAGKKILRQDFLPAIILK